ncbi:MAG: type II toxin-antitoxin system VapC family toxin [Myxococcota bacterium]
MTGLLLDTHALIWWVSDSPTLSLTARTSIEQAPEVFVSAVNVWEIAIKRSLGKLHLHVTQEDLARIAPTFGFTELPVTARHAAAVENLPWHHADPFDRLLVAQAQLEGATLVTADTVLAAYGVAILSATA